MNLANTKGMAQAANEEDNTKSSASPAYNRSKCSGSPDRLLESFEQLYPENREETVGEKKVKSGSQS